MVVSTVSPTFYRSYPLIQAKETGRPPYGNVSFQSTAGGAGAGEGLWRSGGTPVAGVRFGYREGGVPDVRLGRWGVCTQLAAGEGPKTSAPRRR